MTRVRNLPGVGQLNPAMKNQRDLIRSTHIEMIPDDSQVSEISNWRNAISYPYPYRRSASVKTEGKRRDQRAKELCSAPGLSRSQIFCNSAALLQLWNPLSIANPGFIQLALGLMTVEPQPYGKGA
jgi:hypothetical protein